MSAREPVASAGTAVESFQAGGVRTLLRPNPANPVVAARLYVRGGCMALDAVRAGVELVYARAARRGTRSYPKDRLNAALARLGAEVGAGVGEDWTVFHLRCLRPDFETAWKIFTDVVLRPLLEADEVRVVREQTLTEIRQRRDNPDGRLAELARQHAYHNHPYAVDPAGTESAVENFDADVLRNHMRQRLVQNQLLLVVVGNVERNDLTSQVETTFSDVVAGGDAPGTAPALAYTSGGLRVESRELPTNYIMGQFPAPALGEDAYPATMIAMSILRDRFFEEVRTKRNLSYAPAAGLASDAANHGFIYVTAVDPVQTMQVMLTEMRRLRDEPLDPKELADKVGVYVTRYYMQNETNHAQARFLGRYELLGGGWERSLEFVDRLEALTPAAVRGAAEATLRNIQYTYLGNPDGAVAEVFVDP